MNVHDTVTMLITNWPTMYTSRADALKHCFTSPRWSWVDGELVAEDESELVRDETFSPLHEKVEGDIDQQLRTSKRNAIATWTVENAALLAQDTMSTPTHDCLWLPDCYNRFADMPENATEDWHEAALDMLRTLWFMTKKAAKGTHEYNAHRTLMVSMVRYGLASTETTEKRLAELREEVAALEATLAGAQ